MIDLSQRINLIEQHHHQQQRTSPIANDRRIDSTNDSQQPPYPKSLRPLSGKLSQNHNRNNPSNIKRPTSAASASRKRVLMQANHSSLGPSPELVRDLLYTNNNSRNVRDDDYDDYDYDHHQFEDNKEDEHAIYLDEDEEN